MRRPARRFAAAALALAAVLVAVWTLAPRARAGAPAVVAVGPIALTVADADRSAAFYREVLGFERASDADATAAPPPAGVAGTTARVVRLRLGDEALDLVEYRPRGRPLPTDSRSHDRWFQHVAIIVSDMDRAYARLRDHRVEHVSPAPQRLPDWNPVAGGIRAFYFKDPDGHPLEILWFPPGKGDARWHAGDDRLFLGIDHTAIVVADTTRSLACYRDALGLRVAGHSENRGPEQERLNNVAGARLRITTLRAGAGPGVELLEYLAPRDGRPMPAETRADDIAHWETTFATRDAGALQRGLRASACAVVAPDATAASDHGWRGRDPDGHAFRIVDR
jgi:catechol 2,3-dioxygenase-like lactoylglutathione lyase family enzyme